MNPRANRPGRPDRGPGLAPGAALHPRHGGEPARDLGEPGAFLPGLGVLNSDRHM